MKIANGTHNIRIVFLFKKVVDDGANRWYDNKRRK